MVEKTKKAAKSRAPDARISLKHSVVICKALKGKRLEKAKTLLQEMSIGKIDLNGKYYTKASKKFLELLNEAQANAAQKGMDAAKLFVTAAKPSKGRGFYRPRSRAKLRGRNAKSTNVEIILDFSLFPHKFKIRTKRI